MGERLIVIWLTHYSANIPVQVKLLQTQKDIRLDAQPSAKKTDFSAALTLNEPRGATAGDSRGIFLYIAPDIQCCD